MATLAVIFLILMALISIPLYFSCDYAIERFRRNPDPARIADLRQYALMMNVAAGIYYASAILVSLIIDPTMGRSDDDGFFPHHRISGPLPVALLSGFALRAIFGARRRRLDPARLPPYAAARLPSFFARSDILREEQDLDRNYKIFAAPTMLCGACVERAEDATSKFRDVIAQYSLKDAMFYDAFDVTWPEFLQLNDKNFQLAWRDVASIECDPTPRGEKIVDAPNSGSIIARLKSGAARELVLLGTRDVRALRDELQKLLDKAA